MLWHTVLLVVLLFASKVQLRLSNWTKHSYFQRYFHSQFNYVSDLQEEGHIKSDIVTKALLQVEGDMYEFRTLYEEMPRGDGTNPPYMVALALETLKDHLKPGMKAMDVACGSAYLTACMAVLVGDVLSRKDIHVTFLNATFANEVNGHVVGVLNTTRQAGKARWNINRHNPLLRYRGFIRFIQNNILEGAPRYAPFDAIHVGEGLKEVPKAYLEQLKYGGRLMISLEDDVPEQGGKGLRVFAYDKNKSGRISKKELAFVPYQKGPI